MLTLSELRNYISLRGLSIRDIEAYCKLGAGHISNILNGDRPLTEENHKLITDAINNAYFAKLNGTFKRAKLDKNKNAIKQKQNKAKDDIALEKKSNATDKSEPTVPQKAPRKRKTTKSK